MTNDNFSARLRGVNDLGVVALLVLLAGVAFEIVTITRLFQGGSYFFPLVGGIALVGVGIMLGRRSIGQGPRKLH